MVGGRGIPVENTALAPLAALLASLHVRTAVAARVWRRIAAVAVLLGIALPGRASRHRSTRSPAVGRWRSRSCAAATAVIGASAWSWRADVAGAPLCMPVESTVARAAAVVVGSAAGWMLVVVGSSAVASLWLGTRDPAGAIQGRLLGRLVAPVGLAVVLGVVGFGLRRGQRWTSLLAHVGVLVFALGVVGSLGDPPCRRDRPFLVNPSTSVDERWS